jgi:hypothetical protein
VKICESFKGITRVHKRISIYKRVIKEAKIGENDKYVLRANNKTKAIWHVINKEVGKSWKYDKKIELNDGTH